MSLVKLPNVIFMNEIKVLKEELEATRLAYQMAIQMSQFKAGFLGRTAHELRSPLSRLMGLHQLILSDLCESPEEEREFLKQAYQSAQQLMEYLDDIIAVSKIESSSINLEIQPYQISDIFSEVQSLTYLQAANRNISLDILPPEIEIQILIDRKRLIQVLVMLIDSAISSMDKGKIQVSAHPGGKLDVVEINIDIDCPVNLWQEPVDLLRKPSETVSEVTSSLTIELSPGMKFSLAQTLLEVMQGSLELLDLSPQDSLTPLTRLRCLLPNIMSG